MIVFQSFRNWALSLSLVAAGVLVSESAQAVGLINPPPPDTNLSFSNIQMRGAGVNVKLLPFDDPQVAALLAAGAGGLCIPAGPNGPGGKPECAFFDFRPPTGLPNGEVFFADADPFPGGVFDNVIGDTGTVRDVLLPFLGVINEPNLNLSINIPSLIDANLGDASNVDTFDAETLAGVAIQPLGSGSFVSFNFNGFWNIMNPDGSIGQYEGTVTFSQALSEPISAVLAAARQPAGYFTTLSGQADVVGPGQGVPEPSAMAGLGVVAGLVAMQRSRAKR